MSDFMEVLDFTIKELENELEQQDIELNSDQAIIDIANS